MCISEGEADIVDILIFAVQIELLDFFDFARKVVFHLIDEAQDRCGHGEGDEHQKASAGPRGCLFVSRRLLRSPDIGDIVKSSGD